MSIVTSNITGHMETLAQVAAGSRVLLEIGAEHGTGSTLAFRAGIEAAYQRVDRLWITVDIKHQIEKWLRPHFPFWYFVEGDSTSHATREQVERLLVGRFVDTIFIDTVHTYDHLKIELQLWAPLMSSRGLWVFHDTWMHGRYNPMTDAIKEFAAANQQWRYVETSRGYNGLAILEGVV